jgi:ribonucleases P/MRP protein subunit RPP40
MLSYILIGHEAITPDPLDTHFPTRRTVSPEASQSIRVKMPSLKPPSEVDPSYGAEFEDYAVDIHDWLSLVLLESPRINSDDKIDPFLSRYAPPGDSFKDTKLLKVTWQGFMSSSWAHQIYVQMLLAVPKDAWFAYSVVGFGDGPLGESKVCTILKLPDAPNEFVSWEIS